MKKKAARASHHVARGVNGSVRQPDGRNDAVAASFARAEIDKEDLILSVVDQIAHRLFAFGQIGGRELALEDGVLQMVAEIAHGLKDFAKAHLIANVIADEIGVPHGKTLSSVAAGRDVMATSKDAGRPMTWASRARSMKEKLIRQADQRQ